MVPTQNQNIPFGSDFTLFEGEKFASNLRSTQQHINDTLQTTNTSSAENMDQFYPSLGADFTLFDQDIEVPKMSSQKSTELPSISETPSQKVEHSFPSVIQTPQLTDIPIISHPPSKEPTDTNFDFMTSFATPYTPYQSDFSNDTSLISPYTPVYPVLDFVPTPYISQVEQFNSSPAQSTPFLTPHIDFEKGSFQTTPSNFHPTPISKQPSFDFSLYCKDGSFHVDDEPCDNRQPVLVAPLEEVASYNSGDISRLDRQPEGEGQENISPSQSSENPLPASRPVAAKEKKYACDVCGMRFARKFNLNVHARGHDPKLARPFCCTLCTKAFGRKHDLSRHMATVHNGERPFSCETCHKSFSRKDGLHRHLVKGCPGQA
ncbi:hypothetical protein K493DRAFT_315625 [Basidiobolus meristosporus CBS 931.73]|uniref:C2H2-type domain-containing protein n=1 Tax=Basidiobolus meristosporus CBS 931.73 TaxID=1314790 RepID=A0A1Y1Y861_9FUNG|nr:hypothetical protein K493DRAFT_315625 [Basidiobolus meristosporus CBS 931.73]|eukprot:ORX94158.1 hypothetical protein K493DRAFT_315625 [Basidiobolus meristosporus CBS 931.73]